MLNAIHSVAIVGAGMAGLAAAIDLAHAGVAVTLYDKGRRPGGRIATRVKEGVAFNHGAQFAAARGQAFADLIAELQGERCAFNWRAAGHNGRRFSFAPGMSALPALLAERATAAGARLHLARQVIYLHASANGWRLRHAASAETKPGTISDIGGELAGPFDAIVFAIPSVQAAPLLALAAPALAAETETAVLAPCWAAMLRFPARLDAADVLTPDAGPIAWAARENARPGAAPEPEAWTVHASSAWTRTHLDESAETAGQALKQAFSELTGAADGTLVFAHRWRYALVETPVGQPHLWDQMKRIGACGDWCIGGRIEAAFDSGQSLARAILAV
jgi:predicted NAD/FAD-dependent oxidoreductase